jgi:hypothetical protein
MPRARLKKLPVDPIAVSPAMLADLLHLRADDIAKGVRSGDLPISKFGLRKRILIEDAKAFVRSHQVRKVVPNGNS